MARGVVTVKMKGHRRILRALKRLPTKEQPKALRKALRGSAKRLKPRIAAATPVDTHRLKTEMGRAKIRSAARKRGQIAFGIQMPTRDALGTSHSEKGYFPFTVEYGSKDGKIPAVPWIRATVNSRTKDEQRQIGLDVGKHVRAYWSKATMN